MKSAKTAIKTDMTEGSIIKKLLIFVFPLMVTSLIQVLYNAFDIIVVGLSGEADAVGAVGTTTAFINLIINMFMGCSVGAKVTTARCIGAGDAKRVDSYVHTSVAVAGIFGVICAAVGLFAAEPALAAMGNSGKLLELAALYTKIYFIGVPFLALTNFCIAIVQAEGDTKTPFYILCSSGLLNIVLNLIFVLVFKRSVDGVAAATSISNAASALMLLIHLSRNKSICKFHLSRLRIDVKAAREILRIGLPAGIQSSLFALSGVVIQSSVVTVNNNMVPPGSAYQPIVKGNSAAASIEGFGYALINSVSQAAVSFTGQNVGARKYDRIKKIQYNCYAISTVIGILFAGITLLLNEPLLSLYGVSRGAEGSLEQMAYSAAMSRILIMFMPYFALGFMEVGSCVMQGLGYSLTSTVVSLMGSLVLRIVWIYTVFAKFQRLEIVFLSFPLSWALTAVVHFVCVKRVLKNIAKNEKKC